MNVYIRNVKQERKSVLSRSIFNLYNARTCNAEQCVYMCICGRVCVCVISCYYVSHDR